MPSTMPCARGGLALLLAFLDWELFRGVKGCEWPREAGMKRRRLRCGPRVARSMGIWSGFQIENLRFERELAFTSVPLFSLCPSVSDYPSIIQTLGRVCN